MEGRGSRATDAPPIGDYGVIGDCRTIALVSRDGSIDWYCLPRFDSPSVFGALLDTERGGRCRVAPAGEYTSEHRYLPDTNVLETTFRTPEGLLRLTDAMTIPADPEAGLFPDHEILRRIECVEGEVEIAVVFDPRFDYGRRVDPGRDRGRLGIHFDGGANGLALRSDLELRHSDGRGWHSRATLRAGDRRYLSITSEHAAPVTLCPLGEAADARLEATAGWWRDWLSKCAYDGRYEELVFRSMLALKLLMYPPSGAILAAATTSLPEVPGGERNWDYRYCWLRDASMTIEALLHLGFAREAESFLGWLLHATRLTRPELAVLYDVHGRTDMPRGELDHLAGYHGSRPVRYGNEAVDQLQLDLFGELLRAAWAFVDQGRELDRAEASLLSDLGEEICEKWEQPDDGIWEVRGERAHYTHSKAMCWIGLRCLLELHDGGHVEAGRSREEIEAVMDEIRGRTEREGWSESLGSYVAWYGSDKMDAALLLLGIVGYQDPNSDRVEATRRTIRSRLGEEGLLRRYDYEDGLPGREGAFGICGFWEAELLARQQRVEEACERFETSIACANDLGLFSEQMDPASGTLLGNFPQAFTHIGLLSAALGIAHARERVPEAEATSTEPTEPDAES